MKRLIVNADDLGLTSGVNRGIIEAHRLGIVTSATLMANGAAFNEALQSLTAAPNLAIGCHVDLVQLSPTLAPTQVGSLVEGSRFRRGIGALAVRSFMGKLKAEEIAAEAAAQMNKLKSAGLALSHFDTHKHAHMFPAVLKPLLQAARECGIPAVRNPFEPASVVNLAEVLSRGAISRWAAVRFLGPFGTRFRREVSKAGLATTDGTVGIALTGHFDRQLFLEFLHRIPNGTWELVTHPGYADAPLEALSRLVGYRETELRCLIAPEIRQAVAEAGIELITYADLAI